MAKKMRLIDADALREQLEEAAASEWNQKASPYSWAYAIEGFIDDIDFIPTVDAAPVTRCKDCRRCEIVDETQRYFCRRPLGTIGYVPVQPDDYCSYGMHRQ